jgi:hypothetical protein
MASRMRTGAHGPEATARSPLARAGAPPDRGRVAQTRAGQGRWNAGMPTPVLPLRPDEHPHAPRRRRVRRPLP